MASQPNNPVAVIRQNLAQMAPEFQAALPSHISVEKFTRVAMTAVQNNPDLAAADRRSLFGAIVRLAQDGLLPDGREAAIVIFNTKKDGGWVKAAQAMPMIAGILKKLRQSGEIAKISAHVVHEADEFVVSYGFDEEVTHRPPALDKPRGRIIGAYATAVLKDGSRLLEVMSLEEIERVRNVSRAKDKGPWVDWFGEMARKTVMRRLSKRLPMSTDLEDALDRDETLKPEPAPPMSRLEVLEASLDPEPEAEVIDQEPPAEPEGRTEADHGDQHDGDPADEDSASERMMRDLVDRCEAGAKGDVPNIEAKLIEQRDAMDEGQIKAVEAAIATLKRRTR